MTPDYNQWIGKTVRNVRSGNLYTCYDYHEISGIIFLMAVDSDYRRFANIEEIPGLWELVAK